MGRHTWPVSDSSQQQAVSHLQLTWSRVPPGLAFVTANCLDTDWNPPPPPLPLPFPSASIRWHRFCFVLFWLHGTWSRQVIRHHRCHLEYAGNSFPFVSAICRHQQQHPSAASSSLHYGCLSKHMPSCHPIGQSQREMQLQRHHIVVLCMKEQFVFCKTACSRWNVGHGLVSP